MSNNPPWADCSHKGMKSSLYLNLTFFFAFTISLLYFIHVPEKIYSIYKHFVLNDRLAFLLKNLRGQEIFLLFPLTIYVLETFKTRVKLLYKSLLLLVLRPEDIFYLNLKEKTQSKKKAKIFCTCPDEVDRSEMEKVMLLVLSRHGGRVHGELEAMC